LLIETGSLLKEGWSGTIKVGVWDKAIVDREKKISPMDVGQFDFHVERAVKLFELLERVPLRKHLHSIELKPRRVDDVQCRRRSFFTYCSSTVDSRSIDPLVQWELRNQRVPSFNENFRSSRCVHPEIDSRS